MTCFCLIPGTDNFYFVHEQDFELATLGCQPWEQIIIASRTEFVGQFIYDKPQITETREEMLQMLAYISTSSSEY